MRAYRYYALLMAGFVTVLLCSNLIGPAKVCQLELPFALPLIGTALVFGAGNIFFPISYIFGDILTEVYGYARARRVIWAGFGAMVFATVMAQVIIHLPPAPSEPFNAVLQPAIETVFGSTWRIVVASILAFWIVRRLRVRDPTVVRERTKEPEISSQGSRVATSQGRGSARTLEASRQPGSPV